MLLAHGGSEVIWGEATLREMFERVPCYPSNMDDLVFQRLLSFSPVLCWPRPIQTCKQTAWLKKKNGSCCFAL